MFYPPLMLRAYLPFEMEAGARQQYIVTEDLRYDSPMMGTIIVPKGLLTDFASIPRMALAYIKDDDPCILAPSVVHDYLYTLAGRLPCGRVITREQADQVLREAMAASGARADQLFTVFRAVRWFGGSHWKT